MADGIWLDQQTFMDFSDSAAAGKSLSREIASRSSAWDFSGLVGLLPDPDPILAKRGDGAEILDSLTSDGHLLSVMQTRKVGSMKREFKWSPGVENDKPTPASEKLCERLENDFENFKTKDLLSALFDAPYFGMTPVELLWESGKDGLHLAEARALPHRWFGFNEENQPRFISVHDQFDGEECPWGKFVFCRHFPTYDNPFGLRLLSRCFWPVLFKKGGIKFWVTFTEKYGMPFLLGRYRQGATENEKKEMLASLAAMVQDAIAIVPDGNTVEMLGGTGKTGGTDVIFSSLIDAMNSEISKVIMGQTLTAEVGDTGSYAASKTHEDVLDDYRDSDQAMVMDTMNEIAAVYGEVNAPGVPAPTFSWFESEDPQTEFAERDKTVTESGVRLTKSYYVRRYGYQEDDIDSVGNGSAVEDGKNKEKPGGESAFAEAAGFTDGQQALEDLAGTAVKKVDLTSIEKMLLVIVLGAESYEQAMERLLAVYPDMDMNGLQELMAQAILAADLSGRKVIQDASNQA